MSDRLDNALSSVTPESLPGDPNDNDANLDASPDPGPVPGDQNGEGDGAGEGGRTVDNVRGELTRKLEAQRNYFTGQLEAVSSKIDQLLSQTATAPAQPSNPNSLDDLSVDQLRQYRDQVPEDQRAAFDEYLVERRIAEKVDEKISTVRHQQSFAEQEQEANREAMSRWPDLRDRSSTLYAQTNKILAQLGNNADSDPRAVLNAANEAALQLGLTPAAAGSNRRMTGIRPTAPGGSRAPSPAPETDVDRAQLDAVAQSLGGAFKGGKISDEMMQRIVERTAEYREHKDKFVK